MPSTIAPQLPINLGCFFHHFAKEITKITNHHRAYNRNTYIFKSQHLSTSFIQYIYIHTQPRFSTNKPNRPKTFKRRKIFNNTSFNRNTICKIRKVYSKHFHHVIVERCSNSFYAITTTIKYCNVR